MPLKSKRNRLALACAAILAAEASAMANDDIRSAAYPGPVIEAIRTALNDEYRAEAFYAAVIRKFGEVRPFANIIEAERRHAQRLERLLEAAGQPAPHNPYLTGELAPPKVPDTLVDACRIGVEAEIENAALYDSALIPVVQGFPEVEAAMRDLRAASQDNHLPAFQRCVDRGGRAGGGRRDR